MNQFREYVTGQSFALTLSRAMCDAMEFAVIEKLDSKEGFRIFGTIPNQLTVGSLERRGLAMTEARGFRLTEAGELLYPLLVLAGLCRSETELREFLDRRRVAA